MDKYRQAIVRHEKARASVMIIEKLRKEVIWKCSGDAAGKSSYQSCYQIAFNEMESVNQDADQYNDYIHFDEIFGNGFKKGKYCHFCYVSRMIKKGPLAKAKAEFGSAKRAISGLGKKLIKEGSND